MNNVSIRVANLANLFWDNGSFKYPNTYPRLVDSVVINKTPIMTSPTSGWVVLEGNWNYCEFNGELFFLKKGSVISHKKNKWIYVLIKDHICTIFKTKAHVVVKGIITNSDIGKLRDDDFQFTFPVFNQYTKRIVVQLASEKYHWKKHAKIELISKKFPYYSPVTDKQFTEFVCTLESNHEALRQGKQWTEIVKKNKQLVLLGRLGVEQKKQKGWKNELVDKINEFLKEAQSEDRGDIVLGKISQAQIRGATKLSEKWAISYSNLSIFQVISHDDKEVDIDLSGLTDIELINIDNPPEGQQYAKDYFNLFLKFDENTLTDDTYRDRQSVFIKKLTRRVRLPFLHERTTRALYQRGGHLVTTKWSRNDSLGDGFPESSFYYPQKIFFEITGDKILRPLDKYAVHYPTKRYEKTYRSVYLYWCFDLNFYFAWRANLNIVATQWTPYRSIQGETDTWFNAEEYFKTVEKDSPREWIHKGEQFLNFTSPDDIHLVPSIINRDGEYFMRRSDFGMAWLRKGTKVEEYYRDYHPWFRGGYLDTGEPINIGWLLGQFSSYIKGQDGKFETDHPYIVKLATREEQTLKRLKGFKEVVSKMIHLEHIYSNANTGFQFTPDLFDYLPNRTIQKNKLEEDFLIGEKLLTTCWGMAPWLLFQPISLYVWGGDYGNPYIYHGWFYDQHTLGKWIDTGGSWSYSYYIFDSGSYFTDKAKQSYKTVDEREFTNLTYKMFYSSPTNYKELKKNIVNNTEKYFETEEVTLKNTPLKELKVGDIFYSDDEWYWIDQSSGSLGPSNASDFFTHRNSLTGENQLHHEEIVAYLNPKDNKIYLGQVSVWNNQMVLPEGQYIATDPANDSSSIHHIDLTYTRITPVTTDVVARESVGFESMQVMIDTLKQGSYMKKFKPNNLKEITDLKRDFLFNLKGTPFWCFLDRLGRVSLIFKNKEEYLPSEYIEE